MRYLVLVLFLTISLSVLSQPNGRYRLYQYHTQRADKTMEPDWKPAKDLLVVFGTKRITFYSEPSMSFDLIGDQKTFYDKDLDADVLKTDAIDEMGTKCQIWIGKYQNPETLTAIVVMVFYDKITWAYRLKKAE